MEVLATLFAFPAHYAGILFLATLAYGARSGLEQPEWLRLLVRALLYEILLMFLFFSYTFSLSAALSSSYVYFVMVFTALFACTSFLLPELIVGVFGNKIRWFARSVRAFGYAFVLLTFFTLLVNALSVKTTIPKAAILLVTLISLSLFVFPRLIRTR